MVWSKMSWSQIKNDKYFRSLIMIVVLFLYFTFDDVKTYFALLSEKQNLPHYISAKEITESEFKETPSEFRFNASEVKDDRTANLDMVTGTHYVVRELWRLDWGNIDWSSGTTDIRVDKYIHSTSSNPEQLVITPDKRFRINESFSCGSCGSCGCSCYVDRELIIVGDRLFLVIGGSPSAMPLEKQGVYFYNNSQWLKLIPKLDYVDGKLQTVITASNNGKIKIFNKGCSLAYSIDNRPYRLDICSSMGIGESK